MKSIRCPGCGSAFPLQSVAQFQQFACSVCGEVVIVPSVVERPNAPAGPLPIQESGPPKAFRSQPDPTPAARPPAQAPAQPPPRTPAASRPATRGASSRPPPARERGGRGQASRGGRDRGRDGGSRGGRRSDGRSGRRERKSKPNAVLGGIVGVIAFVGTGMFFRAMRSNDSSDTARGRDRPAAIDPGRTSQQMGDPNQDPAVWRALPEVERTALRLKWLNDVDRENSAQLEWLAGFFGQRGETEAREKVLGWVLDQHPNAAWAHEDRGDLNASKRIDLLAEECPIADEVQTAPVLRLERLREEHGPSKGPWWVAGEIRAEVEELEKQIRADEIRLAHPFEYAVARWAAYQRTIEVMREYPAIHAGSPPYVIFVQVGTSPGQSIDAIDAAETERAQRILDENVLLFDSFYTGFHDALGGHLTLTRHTRESTTVESILKVNVFSREADYDRYNDLSLPYISWLDGVRAYYYADEPRFVFTHDGEGRKGADTYRSQCHQAVHQLVHAYTKELTSKALGRTIPWADCNHRPLWSTQGFAQFFSSFRLDGDRYVWMQPDLDDLERLWIMDQALPKLRWAPWSLEEILSLDRGGDLSTAGAKRGPRIPVGSKPSQELLAKRELVVNVMANDYYARTWSLVYYLWNAKKNGVPEWRDRYLRYLKDEFVVRYVKNEKTGASEPYTPHEKELRIALGLQSPAAFREFEADWQAWTQRLIETHKKPGWTAKRARLFRILGLGTPR